MLRFVLPINRIPAGYSFFQVPLYCDDKAKYTLHVTSCKVVLRRRVCMKCGAEEIEEVFHNHQV